MDDELKGIRNQLARIEKKQKDTYLLLFICTALMIVILTNNGMMGQLWDFNFSDFAKFQFIWSD
tara:strand:- start:553 stop:744 length:192 start_codon:yes stop_codon:yes gene_type:complete